MFYGADYTRLIVKENAIKREDKPCIYAVYQPKIYNCTYITMYAFGIHPWEKYRRTIEEVLADQLKAFIAVETRSPYVEGQLEE